MCPARRWGSRPRRRFALCCDLRQRAHAARGYERAPVAATITDPVRAKSDEGQAARVRQLAHPFERVLAHAKHLLNLAGRIDHVVIVTTSRFCVGCPRAALANKRDLRDLAAA